MVRVPAPASTRLASRLVAGAAGLTAIAGIAIALDSESPAPQAQINAAAATGRPGAATARARRATTDVYAADRPGALSPVVRGFPARIYVPNSESNSVDVIDPRSYRIVRRIPVGANPNHITPSWDLRTLWVNVTEGNALVPIDPRTGRAGRPVAVEDPYNLYFTTDGRSMVVVAERLQRLDFRNPRTMRLQSSLSVSCPGVNHMDFTRGGRFALVSCEFGARMIVVDMKRRRVVRTIALRPGSSPQDVKLSADGRRFYVADKNLGGVYVISARRPARSLRFIRTGAGAHGLYVSRDSRRLFVTDRTGGAITVLDMASGRVRARWRLPGATSPDMGGISADGRVLWLSGRYNGDVYALSARSGRQLRRIRVGRAPHGLAVYPQPGRYSLGHTGVFR